MFFNPWTLVLSVSALSLLCVEAQQDNDTCHLRHIDAAMTIGFDNAKYLTNNTGKFIGRHFLFRGEYIYEVEVDWKNKTIDLVEKFEIADIWSGWNRKKVTRTWSWQQAPEQNPNFTTGVIGDDQHTIVVRFDKKTLKPIAGSILKLKNDSLAQVVEIEKKFYNATRPLTSMTRSSYLGIYDRGDVWIQNYPHPYPPRKNFPTYVTPFIIDFDDELGIKYQHIKTSGFYPGNVRLNKFWGYFNCKELQLIGILFIDWNNLNNIDSTFGEIVSLVQHGNKTLGCFGLMSRYSENCTQPEHFKEIDICLCCGETPTGKTPTDKTPPTRTDNWNLTIIIAAISGVAFVVLIIICWRFVRSKKKKSAKKVSDSGSETGSDTGSKTGSDSGSDDEGSDSEEEKKPIVKKKPEKKQANEKKKTKKGR